MSDTSASLLEVLREHPDEDAWKRLVDLYTPLIRHWLASYSVADADVEDLVQETLTVLIRRIPGFYRQPRPGSFRRWLRSITVNCLRDFWKKRRFRPMATGGSDFQQILEQLSDDDSGLSRQWDEEHDRHVTQRLLEMIRPHFTETTWQAFHRVSIGGESPDKVAADLGMTVNAVFIAKSRVLSRLRQEGRGLFE